MEDKREENLDRVLQPGERSDLKSRIEELKRRIAEVEGEEVKVPEIQNEEPV